jgi:hypothetical protein
MAMAQPANGLPWEHPPTPELIDDSENCETHPSACFIVLAPPRPAFRTFDDEARV